MNCNEILALFQTRRSSQVISASASVRTVRVFQDTLWLIQLLELLFRSYACYIILMRLNWAEIAFWSCTSSYM